MMPSAPSAADNGRGSAIEHGVGGCTMDLLNDARRLASVGTFFVIIGWIGLVYTLVAGVLWWINLATRESINVFEAFAVSASVVALPIFAAFLVGGLGYFLRLFALYVATRTQ
jgi:hypothetical protein